VTRERRARFAEVRCSACVLALWGVMGCAAPGPPGASPAEISLPATDATPAAASAEPSSIPVQNKTAECNRLVEVINAAVDSLMKGSSAGSDSSAAEELNALAGQMDAVAVDAAKVELTVPELKKFADDYRKMAETVAAAARETAAAVDAKDAAKVSSAQERMEKAVKEEDPLVDDINRFCQDL